MAGFCISPRLAEKLKKELFVGSDAEENNAIAKNLAEMSEDTRRDVFEGIIGKNAAKEFNARFESKLLLKNQELALERLVNSLDKVSDGTKRDLLSQIQKFSKPIEYGKNEEGEPLIKNNLFNENNIDKFKEDLINKRFEITPTIEESNELARRANQAETKRIAIRQWKNADGTPSDQAMDYGYAREDFNKYVGDLKNPENKFGIGKQFKQYIKGVRVNPIEGISKIGGLTKSLKAGLDDSALLRQGIKTAFTHPQIFAQNALKSFRDIWDTFGGKDVMREVRARMYADPDYDIIANKMKVAVGADDYIPTTIHEKIPYAGKAFAASDNAFSAFMYKTRFDIAKKYLQIAEKAGEDTTDKDFLESVGKLVNSQTGRGSLGKFEAAGDTINNVFFSPRFLVSQLDTLRHAITGAGAGYDSFAGREARKSLAKFIGGIGAIMGIAYAINPDSVEVDPRSTNFMKIKVGNSWNDISGGFGSIITPLARGITQSSKSGLTGSVTKLGERDKNGNLKYGARTFGDTLVDFGRNKFSPIASVIADEATQKTFYENKPTALYELSNLFAPLPIVGAVQRLQDPDTATTIASQILDMLGSSATNYSGSGFKAKKK